MECRESNGCELTSFYLQIQVISIGRERYTVGEALYRPSILGTEEDGITEQLLRCVSLCYPPENQRQLIENIVLCGGTSTMTGVHASPSCCNMTSAIVLDSM
jgi:actin-related protein 7